MSLATGVKRGKGWLGAELLALEVWLLVAAVATPLLIAWATVVRSNGSRFDTAGDIALAVVLSVAVFCNCLLFVHYSSRATWPWQLAHGAIVGALLVTGLWLAWDEIGDDDPSRLNWLWVALVAGAVVVGLLAVAAPAPAGRTELLRGALALGAAVLAVAAIVVALATSWPSNECLRFAGVAVPVVIALWAVGAEWTRPWVVGASLVGLAGVAAVMISIGYDDLRLNPKERIAAASAEVIELSALAEERAEGLDEARDTAVGALAARAADAAVALTPEEQDAPRAVALRALVDELERRAAAAGAALPAEDGPTPESDGTGGDAGDGVDLQQLMDTLTVQAVPDGPDGWWPGTVEQATTAVAAQQAVEGYTPSDAAVLAAIASAADCEEQPGGERDACPDEPDAETPSAGTGDLDPPRELLADRLHIMDVEMARYRAAVTGDAADREAADALAKADQTEVEPVSFLDALERGPEVLSSAVNGNRAQPLVPGPLGWAVFGVLALALWSLLMRSNSRQLAGPVQIGEGKQGEGGDGDAAGTVLRIAVLQNLREPGAVPGSEALESVTALAAVSAAATGWVASVTKALQEVISTPFGYTVAVETLEIGGEEGGDPERVRALARVKDRRTGVTLATEVVEEDDEETAVRAAGLWASGFILARSTRIPSWAAWNAETARALGATNEKDPDLARLEAAVRSAPSSGLLLYLLGSSYELSGRFMDALAVTARAVAAHPRYAVARYRLAASLAMLGAHSPNLVAYSDPDVRKAAAATLVAVVEAMRLRGGHNDAAKAAARGLGAEELTPADARRHLLSLAKAIFVDLERRSRWLPTLAAALRRSERDRLLPLAAPIAEGRRDRRRRLDIAWSARVIHDRDADDDDLKMLLDRARRQDVPWQVTYNAACAAAMVRTAGLPDPDVVVGLLEECLVKPDAHQLDGRWLQTDPDLIPVHGEARFQHLVDRLSGGR